MPHLTRTLLVAAAILAVTATTAQAATPFTAGTGSTPSVAVGPDGSGHVVWETGGSNVQVGYCRVSPGAEVCNRTELLNFGAATAASSTGRPVVFAPSANKVVIVAGCHNCAGLTNRTFKWESADNGSSFILPNGQEISQRLQTGGFGTWLDDASVFVGVNAGRVKANALTPLDEGVPYASGSVFTSHPGVARVPGSDKLVAVTAVLDVAKYGVYNGVSTAVTDMNDLDNWSIDQPLPSAEPSQGETALNAGPSGLFLTYESTIGSDPRIGLRKFDQVTNQFGAATYVEGSEAIDKNNLGFPDSFQDAAGRIHLVWRSGHAGGRLRYRVSDTAGATFSAGANLAAQESFVGPEIAAGGDGKGFAVWTTTTSGDVRVVPLDPQPEPGDGPPGGGDPVPGPPVIGGFGIGDPTLLPGQGTTFSFNSSEAGSAVLTFQKKVKGLKLKQKGKKKLKCVPQTKKKLRKLRKQLARKLSGKKLARALRKRRCKAWKKVGEIRQAVVQGQNAIRFNGRVAGRRLSKGRYRALLVVTDAAGNVSRTERLNFRVLGKKKKKRRRR